MPEGAGMEELPQLAYQTETGLGSSINMVDLLGKKVQSSFMPEGRFCSPRRSPEGGILVCLQLHLQTRRLSTRVFCRQ